MKKTKKVEAVVTETPAIVETSSAKKGRPSNPESKRQQRLKDLAERKANGTLRRGRPANGESARQKRIAELKAKAEANGGKVKRGRPTNGESARQKKLSERTAKIAAGQAISKGRPKVAKPVAEAK